MVCACVVLTESMHAEARHNLNAIASRLRSVLAERRRSPERTDVAPRAGDTATAWKSGVHRAYTFAYAASVIPYPI